MKRGGAEESSGPPANTGEVPGSRADMLIPQRGTKVLQLDFQEEEEGGLDSSDGRTKFSFLCSEA